MTNPIAPTKVSSYLQYLPAVFQEAGDGQEGDFLGRFLLAFEQILSGLEGAEPLGLEEIIARIDRYFYAGDPEHPERTEQTPPEFLAWLASWVALTLRADWREDEQRRFLARIVPLYRLRGTKAGLIKMVETYTGFNVQVQDLPMQVGVSSTVGRDTLIGGPHHFHIRMTLQRKEGSEAIVKKLDRVQAIALAIVDQEKPAHTHYSWQVETPTMQIGTYSHVGIDTFLGSQRTEEPS